MRPFDLVQPTSIKEALDVLARHGEAALVLAGGQSLLILLRQRMVSPDIVVDAKTVPELAGVRVTGSTLRVGATETYASVARSSDVAVGWPLLARAAAAVGSIHIRERGTVGGAVAHSDPAGDVPVALMALDAMVEATGPDGAVETPAASFATGFFSTRLEPGALVTAIRVPVQPAGWSWGYERFLLREGEFPLTQAAVRLAWDGPICTSCRLAVGGGGDRPMRLPEVEDWLVGKELGPPIVPELVRRVREVVSPFADVRGSAEWKARVVSVVAGQALRQAVERPRLADA